MQKNILFFLMIFIGLSAQAQKYTTAAGIRLGTGIGVTIQQAIGENKTIEGIVQKGFFNDLTSVSLLYEQHNKLFSKALNFYLGAGPHIGLYSKNNPKNIDRKNAFGASFIGGLEFKFNKMLLSFDYKPSLNITGGDGFFDSQAGVSLRYIFIKAQKKKAEKKEQKWKFWKKKDGGDDDE
ncbi:MAG: hypothetical protein V4722_18655 [Bacteroidota bacterium]